MRASFVCFMCCFGNGATIFIRCLPLMDSNEIDKKEKDDPMQSNDMLGRHLSSIGTNNENHSNCVMYGFVCSS